MTQAHLGGWAVSGVPVGLGVHVPVTLLEPPEKWQDLSKEMVCVSVAVI